MLNAVSDRAIALRIPIHERVEAIALIHDGSRCYGAVVRDLITGELIGYVAELLAIATGGAGKDLPRFYKRSNLWYRPRAIALETGVAMCGKLGGCSVPSDRYFSRRILLVTEGCPVTAGLGFATSTGHRFMPDVEPAELAS